MSWKNGYYYRSKRQSGRVVSEYVGSGLYAQLEALLDQEERERRQAEQAERDRARNAILADERQLDQVESTVYDLVKAAYLLGGYRSHNRQWRKRNG